MVATGIGYGKIILFNEHFVVYGVPAIAAAIDKTIRVDIEDSKKMEVIDRRQVLGREKIDNDWNLKVIKSIASYLNVDLNNNPVKMVLSGDIPLASGLGASAATCVAIARALSDYFDLDLGNEEINLAAYQGEKIFHGNPSGIDNTIATYGGIIWCERKNGKNITEPIRIGRTLHIVIGNTGVAANTKEVVEGVRRRREKYREEFDRIFSNAEELAYTAKKALENGNIKEIGSLMNMNQEMLRRIGVSCKELEFLIEIALNNGALGAKLTGSGKGGNMIALAIDENMQNRIANAMGKEGFSTIKTMVG